MLFVLLLKLFSFETRGVEELSGQEWDERWPQLQRTLRRVEPWTFLTGHRVYTLPFISIYDHLCDMYAIGIRY